MPLSNELSEALLSRATSCPCMLSTHIQSTNPANETCAAAPHAVQFIISIKILDFPLRRPVARTMTRTQTPKKKNVMSENKNSAHNAPRIPSLVPYNTRGQETRRNKGGEKGGPSRATRPCIYIHAMRPNWFRGAQQHRARRTPRGGGIEII